ncbi:hypothetical protein BOTBODRAFT_169013 [Botryobasidium botryosum FD-172 SS1]|uniref:TECPR1-like DysF domain-containing protein n=1 Tax=Botryobasidium botryosum (strain FD-172 SS1) TaxID=930990 RepID=A0A067N1X4_BOTB1|nr:hypothetical protein BOTBODRAFT_169013 [Botryobasidium botryosum FD-172 SS1]
MSASTSSALPPPSPSPSTTSTNATANSTTSNSLLEFLNSVPPPVTRLLVELAPALSWLRWLAQVVSWKSNNSAESWLLLAAWFLLPLVLFVPFLYHAAQWYLPFISRPTSAIQQLPATTEQTLSRALSDVSAIHALLPSVPDFASVADLPTSSLLRAVVITYLPYALTMFLVPTPIVIGALGTAVLVWRAPWVRITHRLIVRNGWMQLNARRTMNFLCGIKPVAPTMSTTTAAPALASQNKTTLSLMKSSSKSASKETLEKSDISPSTSLRFRFTLYENQRWWMGLDWTAALLPNERPSWSSAPPALHPLPPLISFTLPPPVTAYLPAPGKDSLSVKRTATWAWEDAEWGVIARKSKDEPATRLNISPPVQKDSEAPQLGETLLTKGLKRVDTIHSTLRSPARTLKEVSPERKKMGGEGADGGSAGVAGGVGNGTHINGDGAGSGIGSGGTGAGAEHDSNEEDEVTDPEGWIYGDNKWEGGSGRGGMGKYTRYRRWVRIAVLSETVELVPTSEIPAHGLIKDAGAAVPASPGPQPAPGSAPLQNGDLANHSPKKSTIGVKDPSLPPTPTTPAPAPALVTKADVSSTHEKHPHLVSVKDRLKAAVKGGLST